MKRSIYSFLMLYILSIVITSCGRGISSANDLALFKKGMNFNKIDSMYNIADNGNFIFEFDNQKYQAYVIFISNYKYSSKSSNMQSNNGFGIGASTQMNNSNNTKTEVRFKSDEFFLIFKENKLYSFSYLYEYAIEPSNKLNQFGLALLDGYKIYLRSQGVDYDKE